MICLDDCVRGEKKDMQFSKLLLVNLGISRKSITKTYLTYIVFPATHLKNVPKEVLNWGWKKKNSCLY